MRNLPSISNNSSPSLVPSSEAIEEAIALTFSKVTVIDAGIERKVNSADFDASPDVLIVIGQGIPENVKEQLKYEVIRKRLNCHFIGDGQKNLSLKDIESYREIFALGDTQGLVFCHGYVQEGQHTVMLSNEYAVPTLALNHALRNKPSEFSTADEGTRWDGMLNYFCCQLGKLRNQDTLQGLGKEDGLNFLHSSGKNTSLDVQLINACAVLDYVGDCKANREELDPHQLMARVADVSGESLSLTGLPSGVPLLLRAPKRIVEADPDSMLAAIESPFRIRRNKLLSGDKADMKKFIDIRRAQTERSNQHMNTKLFSVLTTRLERGDTAAAIRILKYYPEIVKGQSGLSPIRLALLLPETPVSLLQALREAGADFKIRDTSRKFTLMHFAACHPDSDSLKKIMAFEPILIDTLDKYGVTPLHLAVRYKNMAVIMELLRLGARVDIVEPSYHGLLHLAVETGDYKVLELLLEEMSLDECQQLLRLKDDKGNTALHLAADNGQTEMIDLLLKAGADAHEINQSGRSALQIARLKKNSGSAIHDGAIALLRKADGTSANGLRRVQ